MGTGARPDTGTGTRGRDEDGLRRRRAELLAAGGPGARLDAAGLRAALTDLYEDELRTLWSRLGLDDDPGYVLLAFGGLGRRETMPHGDLDLVLVHDRRPSSEVTAVADGLWYPLWDAHLTLDHSVRTPAGCLEMAAEDLTVSQGLLEARVIAGNAELGDQVRRDTHRQWRRQIAGRFDDLQEQARQRRRRAGVIAHRMEPDLKNGEGGLRDVQLLDALAAAHLTDGLPAPLAGTPGAGLPSAHRLVLDVRTHLHRVTGRSQDVLLAEYADEIAAALDVGDRFDLARGLSDAARTIAYATDVGLRAARSVLPGRSRPALLRRRPTRRPLAEGVVEQGGEVVLARGADVSGDPFLGLRVAAAAARCALPIGVATLRRLAEHRPATDDTWPAEALDDLLVLLGSGEAQIEVIEACDRGGLWGQLFPEWEAVRDLPARDRSHVHTVDRHLVQTAVEASRLTTSVQRADLLLLAALLHDLGKGRDREHCVVGAELAETVGRRLGLDRPDRDTLSTVVRHHLLLAVTAGRRDPADPATADAVLDCLDGDIRALDVLAALTEADSRATGPGVWTDWRASVHDRLVRTCRERAGTVADAPERPELRRLSVRSGGLTLRPTLYGTTHELEIEVAAGGDGVPVLSRVLAAHGLDIVHADLTVTGGSEPTLRVHALVATDFGSPVEAALLRPEVLRAVERGLTAPQRAALRRRERADDLPAQAPPTVRIADRRDGPGLLVEVRTENRPTLLGRVVAALTDAGAQLDWAVVRTRGAAVEDVFAVTVGGVAPEVLADRVRAQLPVADTL